MQPVEGSETADDDGAQNNAQKGAQRNAFTALMSRKPQSPAQAQPQHTPRHASSTATIFKNRDGLGAYLDNPASLTSSSLPSSSSLSGGGGVLTYTPDFVTIHDLYPKSSVHLLLLPRDRARTLQHPFVALADPDFLAKVRAEAAKTRRLVAAELRRLYGRYSRAEQARRDAMDRDIDAEANAGNCDGDLPAGRDWESDVMCGVHAHPSMNHLHIHVLSIDRHSTRMKHRKHYNSFATPFFVPLEDFPLAEDDVRRHPGREGYLRRDLVCWRCGANFGNGFARLKGHLDEEFEEWKCL